MNLGHIHIGVQDLLKTVAWMSRILKKEPVFQNPRMASFDLENISLVFDQSEVDTEMTLAMKTLDCDKLFKELIQSSGVCIEEPQDQPWGVRTAYLQGPGALTIELKEILNEKRAFKSLLRI